MRILINDEEVEIDGHPTVAGLLDRLGYPEKGIAVAVDWAVVPRSDWHSTLSELAEGSRIDIVTAVQGG